MTKDEIVGWHHQLDGHEFEQPLGVGDGQGRLAYCSPVQFSCSVVSNSLQLHEPQHARPPCHPLLLPPSIFPSIRVFSNESVLCIRWPKYWSFSFNISPSNEYSGLISFRIDWLDLLAVQGTLKSLFQHHSSKASILWCSTFFTVQLSHPVVMPRYHTYQ